MTLQQPLIKRTVLTLERWVMIKILSKLTGFFSSTLWKKENNMQELKKEKYLFTSESVTEGHPDKVCDLIADTILDAYLSLDNQAHVACEVIATTDFVLVMGEISANAQVNIEELVRQTVKEIGYNDSLLGFNADSLKVKILIDKQSRDIAMGVGSDDGAGDQGMMFGYATNETSEFMPASVMFSHYLTKNLSELRKKNNKSFLRPDGKAQVTVEYENGLLKRIDNIVLSTQHSDDIEIENLRKYIIEEVIKKVIPNNLLDDKTKYFINPTGRFVIGGPQGDSGLTGRKIIVDTYGGFARHGGGSFSGKDPSKVDRSAAYMARYVAKNLVAAGFASRLEIGFSYAIGVAEPTSIMINDYGTSKTTNELIISAIRKTFDLTPKGIINCLNLRRPIYKMTTNYGHFGKTNLPWEKLDKVEELKKYL